MTPRTDWHLIAKVAALLAVCIAITAVNAVTLTDAVWGMGITILALRLCLPEIKDHHTRSNV